MLARFFMLPIRWYQTYISPHLGHNCRFLPTCSEYALQALALHGAAKGGLLAAWRILRCNPFGKAGYDPVPEQGRWKNEKRNLYRG